MNARRVDPPLVAGERSTLEAYLDEQLRAASAPPSPISLLGLVRHLTEVERNWFQRVLEGRAIEGLYYTDAGPDGEFTAVGAADGAGIDGATGE